jgi:hypothetical protein
MSDAVVNTGLPRKFLRRPVVVILVLLGASAVSLTVMYKLASRTQPAEAQPATPADTRWRPTAAQIEALAVYFENAAIPLTAPDLKTLKKHLSEKSQSLLMVGVDAYGRPLRQGAYSGNSRRWGDISPANRRAVIEYVVCWLADQGCSADEICYLLAVFFNKSGLNPDAADIGSDAGGLAQMLPPVFKYYCPMGAGDALGVFEIEQALSAMLNFNVALKANLTRLKADARSEQYYELWFVNHNQWIQPSDFELPSKRLSREAAANREWRQGQIEFYRKVYRAKVEPDRLAARQGLFGA